MFTINQTVRERSCYCNMNGVLTPNTVSDIDTAFAVGSTAINQTAFSSYLRTNGFTRPQGVTNVKNSIVAGVSIMIFSDR
jgi:hypothetical protein